MFEKEEKNGNAVLRIKGSMSVLDIASIHKELLACFDNYNDLTVNLKAVDVCDISGLQLLYSARKTAESMGKIFLVDGESNSIIDTFNRAGLNSETVLTKKTKIQSPKNSKEVSNGQDHHDG
jgi:anti-anti-sigma factor